MNMASSMVSELILLIVSLLIAGMVAGSLYIATQDLSDSIVVKGKAIAAGLKTNFEIINDPENIPLINSSYVFYVRNTGKTSIHFDPASMVVLIDGEVVPPANLTFDPSGVLEPYELGEIYVPTAFISSGYHKITLITDDGVRKSMAFYVG